MGIQVNQEIKQLLDVIKDNRSSKGRGVYSVCCAQPLIIEAAMRQAKEDDVLVVIEATANQVNQYGGYTGLTPKDYVEFVKDIADKVKFPMSKVVLGGDHLGPVCWTSEPYDVAVERSVELIQSYVKAGFKKIHLDTSMACNGDPEALPDEIVADRAANLCSAAESAAQEAFGFSDICYVIGTEVPPPGGAKEEILEVEVTPKSRVEHTLFTHKEAFSNLGLEDAWERVIGLVVQPGVEFDHTQVIDFKASETNELSDFIQQVPNIVYEAHSTDYQKAQAYKDLVAGHFAILKVGPQLSYAMREAVFALGHIEEELVSQEARSNIREVFEKQMLVEPKHWNKFYDDSEADAKILRRYSFSDRIRYYWNTEEVESALNTLLQNLSTIKIPLPLVSQYLPEQFVAIREGRLKCEARELIIDKINLVNRIYSDACNPNINK